ncbi:MAG TPA: hypothetical protein VN873_15995 [Candidatus Angelobacter sp.]|nr:hypothetical protein [Candidatus Angelobacter sp.]
MNFPKIITGRQTGVERTALKWAIANGVPHEQGEMEDNVLRSGLTLVFTDRAKVELHTGILRFGILRARIVLDLAKYHNKEYLHLHRKIKYPAQLLEGMMSSNRIRCIHVSGSTAKEEPNLENFVHKILDATAEFLKER